MSELIERQAAIDALGEEPEVWSGNDEYEQGLNNQWHYDVNALKDLPSVQPETCVYWDRESNFCALHRPSAQTERKRGEWLDNETSYSDDTPQTCTCSICGIRSRRPIGNFCKRCGADMRGDNNGSQI